MVIVLAGLASVVMLSVPLKSFAQTVELNEAAVEVIVNEQANPETLVVLRGAVDEFWVEESDFVRLRLKLPASVPHVADGRRYYSLAAIRNIQIHFDEALQRVVLTVPAEAFQSVKFDVQSRSAPALTPTANGAFLNYQVYAQHVSDSTLSGAFTEFGIFNRYGVLTSSSVIRSEPATPTQSRVTRWIRLDSAFTHDFPNRIERLTIGDSITSAGSWGSAVRIGGISWGTDFSIRPDLITTPLLTATGTATVPSTVDVFINNQKVSSQTLPPGPFIIDRLPAITGNGQVSMVVRDALGREQILTQNFYSSLALLAPKLSQYQLSAGKVRSNYALQSNDYGKAALSATYRRGISSWFTIEAHGEALQDYGQAVGINAAVGASTYGVFNVIAAHSAGSGKSGSLLGAGVESRFSNISMTFSSKFASRDYRQVSNAGTGYLQFKQRDLAQMGVALNRAGSIAMAYARDQYFDLPMQRNVSITYNTLVAKHLSLSLVASRSMSDTRNSSYFLTFTLPLGQRRAASLTANGGSGIGAPPNEVYASLVQNAPAGNGYGYRVAASSRGNYNADGRLQSFAGDLDVQVARQQGISGQNLYWSGAATLLDGQVDVTRTVNDSFAMIDVDGIADVPVYVDHQLTTHTNKHGKAMLHYLLPYQPNRINIEPTELPLDTVIDNQTLTIAPGYRSGVIARFPVSHVRSATFQLVDEADQVVPAGAQVIFNGKIFTVAYGGMTYVTGYDHGLQGHVSWSGAHCEFRVAPPANSSQDDPLPDLGKIKCRKQTEQHQDLH